MLKALFAVLVLSVGLVACKGDDSPKGGAWDRSGGEHASENAPSN